MTPFNPISPMLCVHTPLTHELMDEVYSTGILMNIFNPQQQQT